MASRKNPASGESMLILLGIGVAGYFAYINNWLASVGLPYSSTTATPVPPTSTGTSTTPQTSITQALAPYSYNPVGSSTTSSSLPKSSTVAPIALGTQAQSAADISNQAGQSLAYILPPSSLASSVPSGYTKVNTIDQGTVFLRNDLYAIAFAANIQVASPLANISMANLESAAGLSGLRGMTGTGLGFARSRSMFPFNPISAGVGIINAPNSWN